MSNSFVDNDDLGKKVVMTNNSYIPKSKNDPAVGEPMSAASRLIQQIESEQGSRVDDPDSSAYMALLGSLARELGARHNPSEDVAAGAIITAPPKQISSDLSLFLASLGIDMSD
jgi:hypothetical protein